MDEKFKHIIDTPSPVVDAIVDKAMFHTRKDDARRFLYFMDSYICYYLNKNYNELCFPIIRIPSCPDWARELFLKYLILRLSIYYNQDSINNLKPEQSLHLKYVDPFDSEKAREARKHNKYISKWNSFKRAITTVNEDKKYIGENSHKNLIFCTPNDLMVSRENKNEFIKEFYTADGAEGSMGGLVWQGQPQLIEKIIVSALNRALNCSSDPICWEGDEKPNYAACFSCAMVSETSCEERNLGLDRRVIVDGEFGFFKDLIL